MNNIEILNLMTADELSSYEAFEKMRDSLYENLYEAYPNLNDLVRDQASELGEVICNQMQAIREKVLQRKKRKLVFDGENDRYFTDESFRELFTGCAYFENDDFISDNGVADTLCYFVNGKIVKYYFKRNCVPYVTVDAWHVLPDKLSGGKSALIFNLGCKIPDAIETGVDFPYSLSGDILELVSRRLKAAEAKGITAYKMK